VKHFIGGTYQLDSEHIKLSSYRLGCLFFANKEIARLSDPRTPNAAAQLEQQFFVREMSHLLLQIAISLRVMDDQFLALPINDPKRSEYLRRRDETDKLYRCMMFDEMPLREVCNKVIHATTVEPHLTEAQGTHHVDDMVNAYSSHEDVGFAEWDPIKWHHLTGNIRLVGRKGRDDWYHLLQVPIFIEAISSLLQ